VSNYDHSRLQGSQGKVFKRHDIQERKAFRARVEKGEYYGDVAVALGIANTTAHTWLRNLIRDGVVEAHLHPYMGSKQTKNPNTSREAKKERFEEDVLGGMNYLAAGKRAGVSATTASRWAHMIRLSGATAGTQNTDPIPWDKLTPEARGYLEDFASFREHVLGRTWNPPWAVMCATELLELYHSEDDEYVVVNLAPGLGKSTLITHDFIVWVVALERAKGLEPTILLGHRAWAKSSWYVKRCRATFSNNKRLISLYGRFQPLSKLAAWSTEELLVEPLDWADLGEKEPTITAGAYDAAILSSRHSIVIYDDLIDKTNSSTPDQREKLVEWWQKEAETRMNQGGLVVLSNARYGPEDLSWFVCTQTDPDDIDAEGSERPLYHQIRFKVHDESRCDGQEHSGPWPDGCLLDPQRANYKRIHRAKVQSEGRFDLVWQQEDTDPAGFLARRVWFEGGEDVDGARLPGCFDETLMFASRYRKELPALSIVTVDPGTSKFWAIEHFLVWPDGVHQLYRAERKVMQAPELLNQDVEDGGAYTGILEDFWQASHDEGVAFTMLVIEGNNAQRWLNQYPFFQRWCMVRGVALIPHNTNRSNKADPERGIEMIGPIYHHGRLRLPYMGFAERQIADQWRKEACSWPEGQTDDLLHGHWFLTTRMEQLLVGASVADSSPAEDQGPPAWARNRTAPKWATKRVS
jgi:hypothetical protein